MDLNMLTGKSNELARVPLDVDEKTFWRYFLEMRNIKGARLTRKEVSVLSFILSLPEGTCYFTKPGVDIVLAAIDKLSIPELKRMRDKYVDLGLVVGDRKYTPSDRLLKVKRYLDSKQELTLVFPFHIQANVESTED